MTAEREQGGRFYRMARTGRTLSHLRASQLLWRLRYRLERRLHWSVAAPSPRHAGAVLAGGTDQLRAAAGALPWLGQDAEAAPERTRLLSDGVFRFLGRESRLGCPPVNWRLGDPDRERLWVMTLHTHSWAHDAALVAAGHAGADSAVRKSAAETFRVIVADWIERCAWRRPGSRALAWNSYTIATRLRWWIAAFVTARRELFDDQEFESRFLDSIRRQAAFLDSHLEWDLRGNHVLRDVEGLAWAGALFAGPLAARWRQRAGSIARAQAAEQVLPDGGHFERSGRYHVEVMQDLATIAVLAADPRTRQSLTDVWRRMAEFLLCVCHPDGSTHQLNDSSMGASLAAACVGETAALLGVELETAAPQGGRLFADTGLAAWHGNPWTLFVDVGPIGAKEQPGHAHADSLTLECSVNGERLFVDPGTFAYDLDDRRTYDRSTAAHNTIDVDGVDSSEVWHIFRVGRRAQATVLEFEESARHMRVRATHDGYRHLPGSPRHERTVAVGREHGLAVSDEVHGAGQHRLSGGLLVAPGWQVDDGAMGWALCHVGSGQQVRVRLRSSMPVELFREQRPYHPRFGVEVQTCRIGWLWDGELPLKVDLLVDASDP